MRSSVLEAIWSIRMSLGSWRRICGSIESLRMERSWISHVMKKNIIVDMENKNVLVEYKYLMSEFAPVMQQECAQTGGKKPRSKKVVLGKKAAKKAPAKKATGKKGGSLGSDVANLAVPFAILLAKHGLQAMMDNKKSASPKSKSASPKSKSASPKSKSAKSASPKSKSPKSAASVARRRTVVGGSSGGRLDNLSAQVEKFLKL